MVLGAGLLHSAFVRKAFSRHAIRLESLGGSDGHGPVQAKQSRTVRVCRTGVAPQPLHCLADSSRQVLPQSALTGVHASGVLGAGSPVCRRMPCRSPAGAARQLCLRVTAVNSSSKCDTTATSIPVRRVSRGSTVSMVTVATPGTYGAHAHGVVGGVASTRCSKPTERTVATLRPAGHGLRLAQIRLTLRPGRRPKCGNALQSTGSLCGEEGILSWADAPRADHL
jgi:hypothetical protein